MAVFANNNDTEKIRLAELVLDAQGGGRAAFGALFERYERHVFSIALRRLGDYTEAQELCQDVFVQAMQKLNQLREPECFVAWLKSITNRMAINRMIRRGPDVTTEPTALEATCVERSTPLEAALESERDQQLRDGLTRLRELDRQTLEAFYVRGRSLIQMSDEFDAPVGTIKRRLHVARKRLAKKVAPPVAV